MSHGTVISQPMGLEKTRESSAVTASREARYINFDLLRLFLALEVLVGHCWITNGPRQWIDPVPAFVCLSGFLIPASFSESKGWSHFAWKRLVRVGPAFLLSLLLTLVVLGPGSLYGTIIVYITVGTVVCSGCNGVFWSLMVEELLYGSHVLSRIKKWWSPGLCVAALMFCLAICTTDLPLIYSRPFDAAAAYFTGNLIFFYWQKIKRWSWVVAGASAAIFIIYGPRMFKALCGAIGLRTAEIPSSVAHPENYFAIIHQSLGSAAPYQTYLTCIIGGLVIITLRNAPQLSFGNWHFPDLSYGLYVYHLIVIVALRRAGFLEWTLFEYALPISLALACLSWYCIESPALKQKNRPWQLRKKPPEAVAV